MKTAMKSKAQTVMKQGANRRRHCAARPEFEPDAADALLFGRHLRARFERLLVGLAVLRSRANRRR